jgi:hypothetical protein
MAYVRQGCPPFEAWYKLHRGGYSLNDENSGKPRSDYNAYVAMWNQREDRLVAGDKEVAEAEKYARLEARVASLEEKVQELEA